MDSHLYCSICLKMVWATGVYIGVCVWCMHVPYKFYEYFSSFIAIKYRLYRICRVYRGNIEIPMLLNLSIHKTNLFHYSQSHSISNAHNFIVLFVLIFKS